MIGDHMKKKDSDYTVFCYIGIFLCLVFIILPPLFRKVLAKPAPVVVETDYVQLQCSTSDNGEIVVMSYRGEQQEKIGQIKYTHVLDAETFRASQLKEDMEKNTHHSRKINEDNNTMTILISPDNPNEVNYLETEITYNISPELLQNPQNQKEYYEQLGFTCEITKL